MREWLERRPRRRKGQALVEYHLVLALIALLVMLTMRSLQPQISHTLNTISNNL